MQAQHSNLKTILIVEDDVSIRQSLQDILELEGFSVVMAENGKIGLEKLKLIDRPCLILLDMLMPVMGGREFLDAAMADSVLAAIPVVVVSSAADASNTKGSKAFVKKPVDIELLLRMVHAHADCS